jgi:tetratricopeptide (TPR) repeat protein
MAAPAGTPPAPSLRWVSLPTALICLALAGYLAITARDEQHVKRANQLGQAGQYAAAVAEARQVTRAPAASRARLAQAYAEILRGHNAAALEQFREAARRDPNNFVIRRDWAFALLLVGRRQAAQTQMARALALNPRLQLPTGFTRTG